MTHITETLHELLHVLTEQFLIMHTLMQGNYKYYRDKLSATAFPAVPYVGVFLKDLTFLSDGNPDYLRGGLINLHKRRQVRGHHQVEAFYNLRFFCLGNLNCKVSRYYHYLYLHVMSVTPTSWNHP